MCSFVGPSVFVYFYCVRLLSYSVTVLRSGGWTMKTGRKKVLLLLIKKLMAVILSKKNHKTKKNNCVHGEEWRGGLTVLGTIQFFKTEV